MAEEIQFSITLNLTVNEAHMLAGLIGYGLSEQLSKSPTNPAPIALAHKVNEALRPARFLQ